MSLSREQILGAPDLRFEEVAVPEWGGTVRIKMLTGAERDAFEGMIRDRATLGKLGENLRATIVASTLVDESGARLFTEADIEALGKKSWLALERVATASARLNKLEDRDIEEAAKN